MNVSINPTGNVAALGADNGGIYLLDLNKGTSLGVVPAHSREVTSIAWIDQRTFVSVSDDQLIALWSL